MIRDLMKIGLLAGAVALVPGLVAAQQSSTPPQQTAPPKKPGPSNNNGHPPVPTSPTFETKGLKKTNTNDKPAPPSIDRDTSTRR